MISKEIDNKNNVGRPFKMMAWCLALSQVLEDENTLFLSDRDLVFLVNQKLPAENQVDKRTFENWKAGKFHVNEDVGREFIKLIEISLIKQKQELGDKLLNDTSAQWTRIAWILERKFAEYNLKHISENINRNENKTIIQITAGNEEQKELIESVMFSDYKIIQPKQIEAIPIDNENEDDEF